MLSWLGAIGGVDVLAAAASVDHSGVPATSTLYVGEDPGTYINDGTTQPGGIGIFDPTNLAKGPSSILSVNTSTSGSQGALSVALVGNTLIGLSFDGKSIRRFNTLTGSYVDQTLSAPQPIGSVLRMVASPDGAALYLVSYVNNAVEVTAVNTFSWTVTNQMALSPLVPDTTMFPTVDPRTGDLWIPQYEGVAVIDPTTWTSTIVLADTNSGLLGSIGQVAFDGGDAWIPVNRSLVEISTSDLSTVRTITLPGQAIAAAAAPGGADVYATVAWVSTNDDVDVFSVSVASGTTTDIGTLLARAGQSQPETAPMAVSADGSTVFAAVNTYTWTPDVYFGMIGTVDTRSNTVTDNLGYTGPTGTPGESDDSSQVTALVPDPTSPYPTQGYWQVASDGGVFSFGDAAFYGSMGGTPLNQPIVGITAGPDDRGYWQVASDGGIFAFGSSPFFGSMGGTRLDKPVVGIASTPDRKGYWEVASDGGVFAFGDAAFYGSMGGHPLNQPIVGIASTPDGKGYFEVAADGGVFAFGDATFAGSMGGHPLNQPIVGIATDSATGGYWMVASDGGIFAFNAPFQGSPVGTGLAQPVLGMASTADGSGYWVQGAGGALDGFGDAGNYGSMGGTPLNQPMVGMGTTSAAA
jgi:hypothetical protein